MINDMTVVKDNEMTPSDPHYRKPKTNNRLQTIKYLTIDEKRKIIELVKNPKRKEKKMGANKTKNLNKSEAVKSLAWLVEAGYRSFVGWILLSKFDNKVTTAVAIYSLLTAGTIVAVHFFKAQQS